MPKHQKKGQVLLREMFQPQYYQKDQRQTKFLINFERETGIEPATLSLGSYNLNSIYFKTFPKNALFTAIVEITMC